MLPKNFGNHQNYRSNLSEVGKNLFVWFPPKNIIFFKQWVMTVRISPFIVLLRWTVPDTPWKIVVLMPGGILPQWTEKADCVPIRGKAKPSSSSSMVSRRFHLKCAICVEGARSMATSIAVFVYVSFLPLIPPKIRLQGRRPTFFINGKMDSFPQKRPRRTQKQIFIRTIAEIRIYWGKAFR